MRNAKAVGIYRHHSTHRNTTSNKKKTKKISVKVNNITNIKQEALLLLR